MRTESQYGDLGGYASALIESKAAEVTELYGLTREDREDIEQELALKVFSKVDKYNPKRGKLTTFLTRVVEHAIGDILDAREAEMRDPDRCECSLNELVPDGEGGLVEFGESLDHERYHRRSGSRTEQELQDLRLDLEEALEKLPPDLRDICEMLKEDGIRGVARRTGIPSSTLHDKVKKIRAHFERAGLAEYFPGNSRTFSEPSRK